MLRIIKEYSLPLILGVVLAMVAANLAPYWYHEVCETPLVAGKNLHWLVNDIFMVLFFALAGVEIVNALSPGGPLNPIKKAVTPLMATAGGILGPIAVFFILNSSIGHLEYANGWGITTATDIALAWLVARLIFGRSHPAVSFLLLLAVADDAIGLGIIAVFYPDPLHPVRPIWLGLVLVAMLIAFALRKKQVNNYWIYLLVPGILSWFGMYNAHLHPALSLVFIVPFIPHKGKVVTDLDEHGIADAPPHSALGKFEHKLEPIVTFGLFFFGFTNAGVSFGTTSNLTIIILLALVAGKTIGITLFTFISAKLLKFGLPKGMVNKDVIVTAVIGGMGLTVALFISQVAYMDLEVQGAAKMGALFTVIAAPVAFILARILRIKPLKDDGEKISTH
ncbi:MAG: Na+/H+ antiporter NhaA [Anaerovoracaceae bacterium]